MQTQSNILNAVTEITDRFLELGCGDAIPPANITIEDNLSRLVVR
jgi:hypothetical protein